MENLCRPLFERDFTDNFQIFIQNVLTFRSSVQLL